MKKLNIIFAGTPDFAVPSLEALINSQHNIQAVFTQPDRPKGRGKKLSSSPVKELALEHGIPVYQPATLASKDVLEDLDLPDLIVVVAYGLIFPKDILEYPIGGCINVHASLLPDLRGAAPIQYAILNGLDVTGVTIMQMEQGLDTGAMLKQGELNIEENDTTLTLSKKLADLGSDLLIDVINSYDTSVPIVQDEQLASYAPKIEKQQAKINWEQSAEQIDRIVRSLNPNPVAYTKFNEARIKIYHTEVIRDTKSIPGVIHGFSANGLDIGSHNGLVRIKQCQFPGKKRIDSTSMFNAYRDFFVLGEKFD